MVSLIFCTCQITNPNKMTKQKKPDTKTENNTVIISGEIILAVCDENKDENRVEEFFIRRSIQDYFINLAQSKIKSEDLRPYVSKSYEDIITAKLEVDYVEGKWHQCSGMFGPREHEGIYVVVHKIIV